MKNRYHCLYQIIITLLTITAVDAGVGDWFFNLKLPGNAVSVENVQKSNCLNRTIPSLQAMENEYKKIKSPVKNSPLGHLGNSVYVNGKEYKDVSQEAVKLYQFLLGFTYRKSSRLSHCKDMLCTYTELFGKSKAIKIIYIALKYQVSTSHFIDEQSIPWSDDELNLIIMSLQSLPKTLYSSKFKIKLTKQNPKYDMNIGAYAMGVTSNRGFIKMLPAWQYQSTEKKLYTLIHEYAHGIGFFLDLQERAPWINFSKWYVANGEYKYKNYKNFVSNYSKSEPSEDFAESFSAYRFDPITLKKKAPKKYEFLKNFVFSGIEYDTRDCSNQTIFTLEDEIEENEYKDVYEKCGYTITAYNVNRVTYEDAKACIVRAFNQSIPQYTIDELFPFNTPYRDIIIQKHQQYLYPNLKSISDRETLLKDLLEVLL